MPALFVLLIGAALRVTLSLREGHRPDLDLFLEWMRGLVDHGLGGFDDPQCNYPPVWLLILKIQGEALQAILAGLGDDGLMRTLLRIPACLADGVIAIVLFAEARRIYGSRSGVAAATLYFLNPVALYDSAFWGQVDSVYTAFVLIAVVALNRGRSTWAGVWTGLALATKLQAIVFVPLIIFDAYRQFRARGSLRVFAGIALGFAVTLVPFMAWGGLERVLERGYGVVGQYDRLSVNAYNLWTLCGEPTAPSSSVPFSLIAMAAGPADAVDVDGAWYLAFTWRRLSMALFTLAVAWILVVHSTRWGAPARALAGGVLALAFFALLTEMHERYAFPAIALLPLWAVGGRSRERCYWLLTCVVLLNLAAVEPPTAMAVDLSAAILILGGIAGAGMWLRWDDHPDQAPPDPEAPPTDGVIGLFRIATLLATIAAGAALTVAVLASAQHSTTPQSTSVYLDDLIPTAQYQGFGDLQHDRSIAGGALQVGRQFFVRGLGTHAPAVLAYAVPSNATRFLATIGISAHRRGTVAIEILVDGQVLTKSSRLSAGTAAFEVDVPVRDAMRLEIKVLALGSNREDHVDIGAARFVP
jgi:hypothetical protein